MPRITEIHYRKLVKIFKLDGWQFHSQSGSHLHYVKPGYKRPVTIPAYKSVPVFIIQNNMETAKMTRKRYFEFLKKL